MATPADIALLRSWIEDPLGEGITPQFPDEYLGEMIDSNTSLKRTAAQIWLIKAGRYAKMHNISESNSTRAMGSIYKNMLEIADKWSKAADDEDTSADAATRIRRIQRPAWTEEIV